MRLYDGTNGVLITLTAAGAGVQVVARSVPVEPAAGPPPALEPATPPGGATGYFQIDAPGSPGTPQARPRRCITHIRSASVYTLSPETRFDREVFCWQMVMTWHSRAPWAGGGGGALPGPAAAARA